MAELWHNELVPPLRSTSREDRTLRHSEDHPTERRIQLEEKIKQHYYSILGSRNNSRMYNL